MPKMAMTEMEDTTFGKGTVFVLGAGFTKAFLSGAPLLVDDYYGAQLRAKFRDFPHACAILDMELSQGSHPAGLIDLERLMTRLAAGMPYDQATGASHEFTLLLSELKQAFVRRLRAAKAELTDSDRDLQVFAAHCIRHRIHCITFNYDDVLDRALWKQFPRYVPEAWCPDWGYGFPCQISEACVRDVHTDFEPSSFAQEPALSDDGTSPIFLLKLHGSVNWRIALGHAKPYAMEALRHHEDWFEHYGRVKINPDVLEPFLEPDPFFVPPILTKTELVEQPILRLVWSHAIQVLRAARRVVFMGYSLPVTDIAASFLFREGLGHVDARQYVRVVDYAEHEEGQRQKLSALLPAYRQVFASITSDQFTFSGARQWVTDSLT
ncbi:MAG: hypothetical protein WD229_18680 [Pirellulales bacterium]